MQLLAKLKTKLHMGFMALFSQKRARNKVKQVSHMAFGSIFNFRKLNVALNSKYFLSS